MKVSKLSIYKSWEVFIYEFHDKNYDDIICYNNVNIFFEDFPLEKSKLYRNVYIITGDYCLKDIQYYKNYKEFFKDHASFSVSFVINYSEKLKVDRIISIYTEHYYLVVIIFKGSSTRIYKK